MAMIWNEERFEGVVGWCLFRFAAPFCGEQNDIGLLTAQFGPYYELRILKDDHVRKLLALIA